MTNSLTINERNKTIEMTKKFANAAKRFGSDEYKNLQDARRDYPNYKVVARKPPKRKDCFKGLTLTYMENYIKSHNDENSSALTDFYKLCGRDQTGEKIINEGECYGVIKQWFLNKYPEFSNYRKDVENILKKIA